MTQNSGEATIGLSGTTATALWAGRVMTGLFVLFMLFDVGIKLMRLPIVDDAMIQLGYPPGLGFAIGVLEAVLLALYLIPRTAILGAVLLDGQQSAAQPRESSGEAWKRILEGMAAI